jgi:hypothetical protein
VQRDGHQRIDHGTPALKVEPVPDALDIAGCDEVTESGHPFGVGQLLLDRLQRRAGPVSASG